MATGKEIKASIKSTKNTWKITKAMELISTVKMKKAQNSVRSARPFAIEALKILWSIWDSLSSSKLSTVSENASKKLFIVFSSNKWLCWWHNINVFRDIYSTFWDKNTEYISIWTKAKDFIVYSWWNLVSDFSELMTDDIKVSSTKKLSKFLIKEFTKWEYKEIVLVYNYYKSAVSQVVVKNKLFPLSNDNIISYLEKATWENIVLSKTSHKIEPDEETILETVLPMVLDLMIYEIFLESKASEHSSRMIAMKNAKDAASKKVDTLTMDYNKARQASVTQEISEIVSWIESMK